jgi:hypothetical protein
MAALAHPYNAPGIPPREAVLIEPCPFCHAPAGQRCRSGHGLPLLDVWHAARVEATVTAAALAAP